MMNFTEYVLDWWQGFIDEHREQESFIDELCHKIGYGDNEWLENEYESKADYLMKGDADWIYQKLFGYNQSVGRFGIFPRRLYKRNRLYDERTL